MATHNVALSIDYSYELNSLTAYFYGTTDINKGDTVNFTVSGSLGYPSSGVTVYGWRSDIWVSPDDILLTGDINGQTFSKVAKVNAAEDLNYIGVTATLLGTIYYTTVSPHIGILAPQDNTPDPFDLGTNLTGLQPASTFSLAPVTVTGISGGGTSISISVTGGGFASFSIEGGAFVTSAIVYNNQRIQVVGTAAASYGTTTSLTLTIGTLSDSVSATTTNSPPSTSLIAMSVGSSLGLNQIREFFAGGSYLLWNQAPGNIRSYYRGGNLVPDIPQNSSIPSSGQISVNQFRSAHTTLFFTKLPQGVYKGTSTLEGATSLEHVWSTSLGDFDVGYGPGMKGVVLYSYSLVQDSGFGERTDAFLEVASGQPGTPTRGNFYVTVKTPTILVGREGTYRGTVNITVSYGGASISTSCRYHFDFWGP